MKEKAISFILRVYENGKLVHRHDTAKYQRFLHHTKLIKWKKGTSAYLCVKYNTPKDSRNDMDCLSKEDLDWGIKSFATEYL